MLQNVYLKSNEISFEVKPLQNIPALEIREKNGKTNLKGKNWKNGSLIYFSEHNSFRLSFKVILCI